MKKLLTVATLAVFAAACSSNSTNTRTGADGAATAAAGSKNAKYQIIDQEFDNLLAPESDYDNLSENELQACGAVYLPPQKQELKTVQPKTEVVLVKEEDLKATDTSRKKKVTNTVNIYEMDGPAPKKVSSTSSTTVTSSKSSSSSTTANGVTTYNSTGSSSTTTY